MTTSPVWKAFKRDLTKQTTKCIHCQTPIKVPGGSTSGLWTHLKSKHLTIYNEVYSHQSVPEDLNNSTPTTTSLPP